MKSFAARVCRQCCPYPRIVQGSRLCDNDLGALPMHYLPRIRVSDELPLVVHDDRYAIAPWRVPDQELGHAIERNIRPGRAGHSFALESKSAGDGHASLSAACKGIELRRYTLSGRCK